MARRARTLGVLALAAAAAAA
jgi:hypothetical protein